MKKRKTTIIPVFIPHKGCPHNCVFCNQFSITGVKSLITDSEIMQMIREYRRTASYEGKFELAFFGGSFTAIDRSMMTGFLETAKSARDMKEIDEIRISTRPDFIYQEILDILSKYGVDTVELGVQSFHDDVLRYSERGHTAEDVFNAVQLLKKNGFKFGIQLMPGLPGDTPEKSIYSAHIACSLTPDCIRIYPTVVFRDTKLQEMYENGKYSPMDLEEAVNVSKEIVKIVNEHGIFIQRLGLHPVSPEEKESIIAGPYHDAFGFLVKSRLKRDLLESIFMQKQELPEDVFLRIPSDMCEEFIGNCRENIIHLSRLFGKTIYYTADRNIITPVLTGLDSSRKDILPQKYHIVRY